MRAGSLAQLAPVALAAAGLTAPLRMNDRKDLAGRAQSRPARRIASHGEIEVERDEVDILVQRLERRDHLFIHTDPEVGLAHPDLDVEIRSEEHTSELQSH